MNLHLTQPRTWNLTRKDMTKRVNLPKGELYALSSQWRGIRVIDGVAWIAWSREAIALSGGEAYRFTEAQDRLISAEGKTPLTFEMWRD
ncbi:MAG: hypothetical protein IT324_17870 [Anaerolineae bacterium]|nr:hypothetical protein [Anaerolineae bacterium]